MNPLYAITNLDPRVTAAIGKLIEMGAPKNTSRREQVGMFNSGTIYTIVFWKDGVPVPNMEDLHDGEAPQGGYECISGWLTNPIGVQIAYGEMKTLGFINRG